jgi:hypothetical protein
MVKCRREELEQEAELARLLAQAHTQEIDDQEAHTYEIRDTQSAAKLLPKIMLRLIGNI